MHLYQHDLEDVGLEHGVDKSHQVQCDGCTWNLLIGLAEHEPLL